MGLVEILGRLPRVLRALDEITAAAKRERPDLAIVVDYPDFHFRLAKRLKRLGIPVVYFIPPKVWVWRSGRVRVLAERFAQLLCILPFEKEFYARMGLNVTYVGNPVQDELAPYLSRSATNADDREWALIQLGLLEDARSDGGRTVVTLMPGSRPGELNRHFEIMLDAAFESSRACGRKFLALIPVPETADFAACEKRARVWAETREGVAGPERKGHRVWPRVLRGQAPLALLASEAGLIKSGTSTLEAGLLGCPHAVVYKPAWLTGWLFQNIVGFEGPVGLVNLAGGWLPGERPVFEEILCADVTLPRLKAALVRALTDHKARSEMGAASERLRQEVLLASESPSMRAAGEVLRVAREKGQGGLSTRLVERPALFKRVGIRALSMAWCMASALSDLLYRVGLRSQKRLNAGQVISVGNLQAGGTGKTPIVAKLANEALAQGRSVCVLTRGYRGKWERSGGILRPGAGDLGSGDDARNAGDEAVLLRDLAPKAWVAVGKNRAEQYAAAVHAHGGPFDCVILDDGFQHRKIHRDIDALVLTSKTPAEVLFRSFRRAARRADLLIWTKGAIVPRSLGRPMVRADFLFNEASAGQRVCLITGVGDSASVLAVATRAGLRADSRLEFADHAAYSVAKIEEILRQCGHMGLTAAITGKDWVKWRELAGVSSNTRSEASVKIQPGRAQLLYWREHPVWVLEPEVKIIRGQELWNRAFWEK